MLWQVPFNFRLVLQYSYGTAGKQQAQVLAKGVKRADITVQDWVDRLFLQNAEMIGFQRGIDAEFPVKIPFRIVSPEVGVPGEAIVLNL